MLTQFGLCFAPFQASLVKAVFTRRRYNLHPILRAELCELMISRATEPQHATCINMFRSEGCKPRLFTPSFGRDFCYSCLDTFGMALLNKPAESLQPKRASEVISSIQMTHSEPTGGA